MTMLPAQKADGDDARLAVVLPGILIIEGVASEDVLRIAEIDRPLFQGPVAFRGVEGALTHTHKLRFQVSGGT
jgi:hypothetical protein